MELLVELVAGVVVELVHVVVALVHAFCSDAILAHVVVAHVVVAHG